jgi:glycosyltransferase involved in cell wall biosynthesis
MSPEIDLTIVIPCFNEAAGIERTVLRVDSYLRQNHPELRSEILVVDDGSTDETGEILRRLEEDLGGLTAHSLPYNIGRGAALKVGFESSHGSIVIPLDADLSYEVEHITEIIAAFNGPGRPDAVVVSPYMKGGRVEGVPFLRLLISRAANWILAGFFPGHLSTVTCVVRGYRGEMVRSLPILENGKEMHLEILRKFAIAGARIVEIPGRLIWKNSGKGRRKISLNLIGSGSRHLMYGILSRPTRLFKLFTLVTLLLGVYETAVLAANFVDFYQGVAGDPVNIRIWKSLAATLQKSPHSVVIAVVGLLLGFQSAFFLILLKVLRMQHEETLRHQLALFGNMPRRALTTAGDELDVRFDRSIRS